MALSFARAGASYIAVGARSGTEHLAQEIVDAASSTGRKPPKFVPLRMDVTDALSVEAAAAELLSTFGRLDCLVNNAGILGSYGLIGDSDPAQWWSVLEVNLRGPYLVTRACIPLLLKSDLKYIINVTSVGALLTNPTLSAYQISKFGLLKLSQLTNVEYAGQGLVTFCIHPGNIPTDIMGGPENIPPHHKHGKSQSVRKRSNKVMLTHA